MTTDRPLHERIQPAAGRYRPHRVPGSAIRMRDNTDRVQCPACGRSLRPAQDRYRPHRIPGSNYVVCTVGTPQPYGPPVTQEATR